MRVQELKASRDCGQYFLDRPLFVFYFLMFAPWNTLQPMEVTQTLRVSLRFSSLMHAM